MICLGVFGYLIPFLDDVYSHVIAGIFSTHKVITSSYDLKILGITACELGAHGIEFRPRTTIKTQALVDFVSEWTEQQVPDNL
jgi:hypothetical protein